MREKASQICSPYLNQKQPERPGMHRLDFLMAPTGHLILLCIAGIKISPVKCWLMHNEQGKKELGLW